MRGLRQKSGRISFVILKVYSGCCVVNRLYGDESGREVTKEVWGVIQASSVIALSRMVTVEMDRHKRCLRGRVAISSLCPDLPSRTLASKSPHLHLDV